MSSQQLSVGRRWFAVVLIALGAFALVFVELLPVGMLPAISQGLSISEGTAGLVVTVTAWVAAIAAPVIPVIARKLDRRWLLAGLTALLAISSLLTLLAPTFELVLIARAILGIAAGGFWAAGILAATALMPEKANVASSLVFGGIALATVLSAPVGSVLVQVMDWHYVYGLGIVLGLAILVLQLALLPSIPAERAVRLRDFGSVLKQPRLVGVLVVVVLFVVGNFAAFTFVTPFLEQVTAVSPPVLSVLLLVFGAITFLGNFVGGHFAGRSSIATVIATGALFVVGLGLLAAFGASLVAVIVGLILWALAWSATPVGTQVLLFTVASRIDHPVDAAQALNTSVFQASIGLGALVGGLAVNAAGITMAMLSGFVIVIVGFIVSMVLGSSLRNRTEATLSSAHTES